MLTGLKIAGFFIGFFIYILGGIIIYLRYVSQLTSQTESWAVKILTALIFLVLWAGIPLYAGMKLSGKKPVSNNRSEEEK